MADVVLVTGINGFIAKHVALALLKDGYRVRGTLRNPGAAPAVERTLASAGADVANLSFVVADLKTEDGWREAVEGCRYVQHLASPFPMQQPAARDALLAEARDGTVRVIEAALHAGVERIVQTSSIAAMMYRPDRPRGCTIGEEDWSDPDWSAATPYIISKTRAEAAAWELVRSRGTPARLAVVNPGFVLGPTLDESFGTSVGVIKLLLDGAYPAVPPVGFPVVDVRDVAAIQVRAMTAEPAGGRRLLAAGETLSMQDMAKVLKENLGAQARRVPGLELPAVAVRLLAKFDKGLRTILPDLGVTVKANSGYTTDLTGIHFRSGSEAVLAAARSLLERGLIKS